MKKKPTPLKQTEFFALLQSKGLSANQYWLLCSLKTYITAIIPNREIEMRQLKAARWVMEDNSLSPESETLIEVVEKLFTVQRKKGTATLLTVDYKVRITEFIELFPNIRLDSGKAARASFGNCENAFRWFFENHTYDWTAVMNATQNYVAEYQKKNWKFMRTSQNFIRKAESDATYTSDLADYCAIVESGGYTDATPTFKTKVV